MTADALKKLRRKLAKLSKIARELPEDSPVKQKAKLAVREMKDVLDELENLEKTKIAGGTK